VVGLKGAGGQEGGFPRDVFAEEIGGGEGFVEVFDFGEVEGEFGVDDGVDEEDVFFGVVGDFLGGPFEPSRVFGEDVEENGGVDENFHVRIFYLTE